MRRLFYAVMAAFLLGCSVAESEVIKPEEASVKEEQSEGNEHTLIDISSYSTFYWGTEDTFYNLAEKGTGVVLFLSNDEYSSRLAELVSGIADDLGLKVMVMTGSIRMSDGSEINQFPSVLTCVAKEGHEVVTANSDEALEALAGKLPERLAQIQKIREDVNGCDTSCEYTPITG